MGYSLPPQCVGTTLLPHYSPVYTGPPTGSGLESGLRPRNAGGLGDPDRDLDRLRLHGAESGNCSRKVVSCKWGFWIVVNAMLLFQNSQPSR